MAASTLPDMVLLWPKRTHVPPPPQAGGPVRDTRHLRLILSKRTFFSFRSGSGCSDRILDIFISLNLSFHDEDAGVFKFSVAQKLATWRAVTEL